MAVCGEVAVLGSYGCNMAVVFFEALQHVFSAYFLLSVSHNTNSIIYGLRKHEKEVENCFELKC